MSGVVGTAGLLVRIVGQLAESAQQDRRDAAEDASEQSQAELEAMVRSADAKKLAAKEDYYIQNLEGTIGSIPVAGKIATTVMTAGQQDQATIGLLGIGAGPVYAPVGAALLASSMARPQLREHNELDAQDGKTDPLTDNMFMNTMAYADRGDRDKNKDLSNRADIDAKRAGKLGSEAKSDLDDSKKEFSEMMQNMRTVLDDQKRASDKIQG